MEICGDCLECNLNETYGQKVYCERQKIYVYQTESACSYFKSRNTSTSCYITTIIHDILKKPDCCEVLETLRNFRDHILQKDHRYAPLLLEYDTTGSKIAEALAIDQDKELCQILYESSLKKIATMIKQKQYSKAIHYYEMLTKNLQEYFSIDSPKEVVENYEYQKGGHGKLV